MSGSNSFFNPNIYYRFANANHRGAAISSGYKYETLDIVFTSFGGRSSENWQIFKTGGHYVIRNYDYGSDTFLGLPGPLPALPRLMGYTAELNQQWDFKKNADGTWALINGQYGSAGILGESWQITENLSAGNVSPDMLVDLKDLDVSFPFCIPGLLLGFV